MFGKLFTFFCILLIIFGSASAGIFGGNSGSSHEHGVSGTGDGVSVDNAPVVEEHGHKSSLLKDALKGAAVGAAGAAAAHALG